MLPFPSTGRDIQLVVVDIDGTIAGPSNQVNPAVVQALKTVQAQGIPVALATGRMYCSARRFHATIGSTLPLIAYQGAWIQDPENGQLHHHVPAPIDHVTTLFDYFEQLEEPVSLHLYRNDQLYVRAILPETAEYAARSGVEAIVVEDLRSQLDIAPTKLLAMSQDVNLIAKSLADLKQRFRPDELYLTTSVSTFLEAAHPTVNKGAAVKYLAEEILKLSANQVMTIGDNFNDLEMLQYAGIGVAMGNAPAGVKAVADWVTTPVEADGVALAMEKLLLAKEI
jgi:Cof subfamily protein (haloacid dehalogenase superfamily)